MYFLSNQNQIMWMAEQFVLLMATLLAGMRHGWNLFGVRFMNDFEVSGILLVTLFKKTIKKIGSGCPQNKHGYKVCLSNTFICDNQKLEQLKSMKEMLLSLLLLDLKELNADFKYSENWQGTSKATNATMQPLVSP